MEQSTASSWVKDVTDRDFQREVIEKSRTVPVVVDLWAPWCGPCKQLGPLLERLAAEGGGKWILAKVNVDESPELAGQYGVRSIPTLLLLKGGQVQMQHTGALTKAALKGKIDPFLV